MSQPAAGANDRSAPHGGWVRRDVSGVAPLGAYPARQCPVRTQWDVLQPADPVAAPEFIASLGRAGIAFEDEIYGRLVDLQPDTVLLGEDLSAKEREAATLDAIEAGAPLVLGGRLPVDEAGRRVAHPDLLVRAGPGPDGRRRYVPVDVKHHATLVDESGADVVVQGLDAVHAPNRDDVPVAQGRRDGTTRKDLLQLAHYWRTLEAHGMAPAGHVWAGILGSESQVAWYRLDVPMWTTPSASSDTGARMRTTLEVYDFEFGFRLDIVATALEHRIDPTVALLVEPVWIDECGSCPWRTYCREQLEARQDVSLLPRIGWPAWAALRDVDATTVPALAALPDDTIVDGMSAQALADAIEEARARIGPDLAYRRRNIEKVTVPRADVEIDVDMENVADGAYLWGCLVTDRTASGLVAPGYLPFANWDADPRIAGIQAFVAFWDWLTDLHATCERAGLTLAAYCWHAPAENRWLRVAGDLTGRRDEVEAFTSSPQWIDLRRVFCDQVITGHAAGLKDVATLLGFQWRDETPGGDQSMLWWQTTVDPDTPTAEQDRHRQRLLDYNEDDVRATLHVRDWLDRHAATLQPVPRP